MMGPISWHHAHQLSTCRCFRGLLSSSSPPPPLSLSSYLCQCHFICYASPLSDSDSEFALLCFAFIEFLSETHT
jgi:hypothetical protein